MIKKKVFIILVILIISLTGYTAYKIFSNTHTDGTIISVSLKTFEQNVEVSGKVAPIRDAHLGFETSGKIYNVYTETGDHVSKGDPLVEIDSSGIISDLSKAQADLQSEVTTLDDLYTKNASGVPTEFTNAKESMIATLQDSFTSIDNAIRNNVDPLYENPQSANPKISFALGNLDAKEELNTKRREVQMLLSNLETLVRTLSVQNFTENTVIKIKSDISNIITFLDNISNAVNSYTAESYLSTSTRESFKSDIATARNTVQTALSNIITAEESLRIVSSKIPLQQSKITSAEASVEGYQVELSKTIIRAPFDGIITVQNAQIGEIASSGTELVSMISFEGLKLEAYVPEVYIAKIMPEQRAEMIFDAYDETDIFYANLITIDPIETIRDGISTYKTTFYFDTEDSRIRSGMTADISIITDKRDNVLMIPTRSLIKEDSNTYVYTYDMVSKKTQKKDVMIGKNDSHGNTEILNGLNAGDSILLNPQNK